jgi:hypothetical protein
MGGHLSLRVNIWFAIAVFLNVANEKGIVCFAREVMYQGGLLTTVSRPCIVQGGTEICWSGFLKSIRQNF